MLFTEGRPKGWPSVRFAEQQKTEEVNLNLRVEFTNVFNRTVLPQPSVAGNFSSSPIKFTSGPNTGLYSSGYGTINPTAGTTGMRRGTFVARIQF